MSGCVHAKRMVWNPVQRDRAGFDANVSWVSGAESTGVPFALPARFFALAQVKASDDLSKLRPYLTLQRALNLIDHHGPAFVLLLDFKGGLDVVECEVLHVSGEFVRLVYERVASATNEELSKQRITVSQAFTKTLKLDEAPQYALATAGPNVSVRRTASGQGTSAVLLGRAWSRSYRMSRSPLIFS